MTITKLGHCCLLVEVNGTVIMTDPGAWSGDLSNIGNVDVVLITHEHPDHFHVDSLKVVLAQNPEAKVVGNSRMVELLAAHGIEAELLEDAQEKTLVGVNVAGFGVEHAEIYRTIPRVENTGFLIDARLFYPGDAFTKPGVPVEIAAMPMMGPWMKLSEALDWVQALKPRLVLPVHDGFVSDTAWLHRNPEKILEDAGIEFKGLEIGKTIQV